MNKKTLTEVRTFRQSGLSNPSILKIERNNFDNAIASPRILPR